MDLEPKKKSNKKRLFFIMLTVIMFIGVSMAAIYFIYQYRDSRENKIKSSLISISFTEGNQVINLTNTVPVIDEIGLSNTPYTFTVKNTSQVPINANIKLDIDSSTNIDLGAVRYAFYINNNLITKDYIHDNLILYTYENMKVDETLDCKLVFWIDYYYDKPNKTFSATVIAEGKSFDIIYDIPTMDKMCPNCVYAFHASDSWYYLDDAENGIQKTTLTSNDYKENYEDLVTETGKPFFLGLVLDQNNKIDRAFSCGIVDNIPFCIEGTSNDGNFVKQKEVLHKIFANDNIKRIGQCYDGSMTTCDNNEIIGSIQSDGTANVEKIDDGYCQVFSDGDLICGLNQV